MKTNCFWVCDPIYHQGFYFIVCKKKEFEDISKKALHDKRATVELDLKVADGYRFTMENDKTHHEVAFIWIDSTRTKEKILESLEHEVLHAAFKTFRAIHCNRPVEYEREEEFIYYFHYLKKTILTKLK